MNGGSINEQIITISAIDIEIVRAAPAAVDGDCTGLIAAVEKIRATDTLYAGLQLQKLIGVTGIEGQVRHLALIHDGTKLRASGVHQRRFRCHLDRLPCLADLHDHIQRYDLVQVDTHSVPQVFLKSRLVELDAVRANCYLGKAVVSALIRCAFLGNTGRLVCQRYSHTRQDCPTGIGHAAQETAAGALRCKQCGTHETRQGSQNSGRLPHFCRQHGASAMQGKIAFHRLACAGNKPCYNRARLEKLTLTVKRKIPIHRSRKHWKTNVSTMKSNGTKPYLKIGDVARRVGVSPSVIRSWESLGLTRPRRTESKYRLYSAEDVKVLKRARFLRRVRGLNAPAIVQLLKREGLVRPTPDGAGGAIGARLRQLRIRRGLSLAHVAKAAGISVGFLSAIERSQMSASIGTLRRLARFHKTNILDFFDPAESNSRLVRPSGRKVLEAGPGVRMELLAWGNTVMEPHLFRIAPQAGSGESYTHEGEEFLLVLRGELQLALDGEEFRLKSGDSFYFESATPHRWKNPGRAETWVLWVNTPPTF